MEWNIVPKDESIVEGKTSAPAGLEKRSALITAFFNRPDRHHRWNDWLRMVLDDVLIIDAPTLFCERSRGGQLIGLRVVDGATIKRVIDDWGMTPEPPIPAYQQVLKGLPALDYTTRDMLYRPRNRRVHKAYGFSPVEQIVMTVNIALRRQLFTLQYFTEGNVPEALIGAPDNWTPEQIAAFQANWDAMLEGNLAQRRHAKFVPGGVGKTFIQTKDPELKGISTSGLRASRATPSLSTSRRSSRRAGWVAASRPRVHTTRRSRKASLRFKASLRDGSTTSSRVPMALPARI
jgi:hypothetical protein